MDGVLSIHFIRHFLNVLIVDFEQVITYYVTAQVFINVKFEKEDTGVVIFDFEHIIPVTFLFSRPLGPKKRKKFYIDPF